MSADSSPIFKRRPRPAVVPETPTSASSRRSFCGPAVVKKTKTRKNVVKGKKKKDRRNQSRVNSRQARLRCPFLELQAKEDGNSQDDDNSSDDQDATDDSIVTSGSDHSDASYSIYALGQSSQAEQYGFTVPLHQARMRALDRPAIADVVLGRISRNRNKNKDFEDYLRRVRDGGVVQDQDRLHDVLPAAEIDGVLLATAAPELVQPLHFAGEHDPIRADAVYPELNQSSLLDVMADKSSFSMPSAIPKLCLPSNPYFNIGPLYSMTHQSFPMCDQDVSDFETTRPAAVRPAGRLRLKRGNVANKSVTAPTQSDSWVQTSQRVIVVDSSAGTDQPDYCDFSMQTSPRFEQSSTQTFTPFYPTKCCESASQTSPRLDSPLTLGELRNEVRELLKGMGF
jgi:hypothetical protein